MGYRSEVGLVVTKELAKMIDEDESLKKLFECCDFIKQDEEYGDKLYHWNWIKWYDEFDEIKHLYDILYNASHNEEKYFLIRVGEEYGDEEFVGRFYDNSFDMALDRRIIYDNKVVRNDTFRNY